MRFLAGLAALFTFVIIMGAGSSAFAGEKSLGAALAEALHTKGVIDDATYADVTKGGSDDEISRRLLDALHKKGVVDDATYKEVSAVDCEPKPVTLAAAPQSSSAPAAKSDRPLDKELTSLEEGFAKLTGDTVKFKIGTFIQAGWLNDSSGTSVAVPPTTNISNNTGNQFFVRRARLFFNGEVSPKIGFRVSTEFAPAPTLQDAYVWMDYIPYNRLTIGQMKQPFGMENSDSLADLAVVNRSLVSNMVVNDTLRDTSGTKSTTLRDMGVTLAAKFKGKTASGRPYGLNYTLGVFNGPGRNLVDDNNYKDFVGRLTVNPFVEGLNVGGSLGAGRTRHTFAGLIFDQPRDRYAVELDYNPSFVKGLKLRGEAMWDERYFSTYAAVNGTNTTLPAEPLNPANTALWGLRRDINTFGWYAMASYKLDGLEGRMGALNGFEPMVRYDYLDEDTNSDTSFSRNNVRTRTTFGVNYYFNKYARLMLNFESTKAGAGLKFKSLQPMDNLSHSVFTTQMQIKF